MKWRYLELGEVLELYRLVMQQSGGIVGIRSLSLLESALAQSRVTFDKMDLYLTLSEKAGALGFSLIQNHAFVDGNKRMGHATIEVFLMLNGYEIEADVDEQEAVIVGVAAGEINRRGLIEWLRSHTVRTKANDEI
jgi:death-on-curing protein